MPSISQSLFATKRRKSFYPCNKLMAYSWWSTRRGSLPRRFKLGSFASEREWAAHFVFGLRISIKFVVATFSCMTLGEVVMRALECKNAHEARDGARN